MANRYNIRERISCKEFTPSNYPVLNNQIYVECHNGSKGIITKTDGFNFYLEHHASNLHLLDIKEFIILDDIENSDIPNSKKYEIVLEWYNSLSGFKRSKLGTDNLEYQWSNMVKKPALLFWCLSDNKSYLCEKYNISEDGINTIDIINIYHSENDNDKVDFEILKETINNLDNNYTISNIMKENLLLFFKLMGKSSKFAHKIHKALKHNQ